MEQIADKVQEALSTHKSMQKNLRPSRMGMPDWVPSELIGNWNDTDIDYRFCMDLFAKLEAAKRDNFPKETMRIWFIEFLKRGWNKRMVIERYEALLGTKIYGTEKIDFADWVNAVPVYAQDEVNL